MNMNMFELLCHRETSNSFHLFLYSDLSGMPQLLCRMLYAVLTASDVVRPPYSIYTSIVGILPILRG